MPVRDGTRDLGLNPGPTVEPCHNDDYASAGAMVPENPSVGSARSFPAAIIPPPSR
ncbi:hypothetical protein SBA5_110167 [Candidatus Sulfotelmatomonas gaucii]|uniref:Uncharacterized protein n=1 Tax=Candidatus Sulfuritelmatomonas gaucii TaxID=2043161 RepID=A0A2N9L3A3_9BACT|nr:hypothetical protein SBA5_110167 [Candidatus Sulfotelmatomonas gaucii]